MQPIEDYERLETVRLVHRAAEDGQTLIQFMPMDELLTAFEDEDEEQQEAEEVEAIESNEEVGDESPDQGEPGWERAAPPKRTDMKRLRSPCKSDPIAPSDRRRAGGFFVSPLRTPLTEAEIRRAWRSTD